MLANIGFVATYIVGSPIRVSEIFLFGFLGFISRSRPLIVQILAFTAGLTYSMVNFISSLFNLPVYEIVNSVRFLNDWRFFSSGEYLAFALAFAGILMVACRAFQANKFLWPRCGVFGVCCDCARRDCRRLGGLQNARQSQAFSDRERTVFLGRVKVQHSAHPRVRTH